MISYELAKELRDAGFPQNSSSFYKFVETKCSGKNHPKSEHPKKFILVPATYTTGGNDKNAQRHYAQLRVDGLLIAAPTLEELIDGCGTRFSGLTRSLHSDGSTRDWSAHDTDDINLDTEAVTPFEAVAGLWLALYVKRDASA